MSRRRFLKCFAGAVAAAVAAGVGYGVYEWSKRTHAPAPALTPTATPTAPTLTPAITPTEAPTETPSLTPTPAAITRVSAILGHDLDEITRQAIDAIGGIESIINPGDKVFIKPNAVGWGTGAPDDNVITNGARTKPEIVMAVADECLKAGASRVIIGEGGQSNAFPYPNAFYLDGQTRVRDIIAQLNERYGPKVSMVQLNSPGYRWVFVPSSTDLGQIAVSSFAIDADKVISIPVLKTHHTCAVTLSMKNFVGITPTSLYGSPRYRLHECDMGIDQCILDIVKGIQPDLAIIDASIGAEGNAPSVGPGAGIKVDMRDRLGAWAVLAGTDPVAVDCTATRMIGHEPMYVNHLRMAYQQGMGERREERIELVGAQMSEIRMEWIPSDQSGYPQKEEGS